MSPSVEILAIGNELLLGDVQDTNTYWLCRQMAGRGGRVRRAAMLPDDPAVLIAEVGAALGRGPDLVLTTGGLGPTDDDLTLAAVAEAVGQPVVENDEALRLIAERYAALAEQGYVAEATLTPPRRKMARLPAGSQPLANPVGTAPAVALQAGRTWIACLPGVPGELKAIFDRSLQPLLRQVVGDRSFAEAVITTMCGDESVLAPIVRAVAETHPAVYVKSRATHFGPDVRLRVTLSVSAGPGEAEERLAAALTDLRKWLMVAGIAEDSAGSS